jgi:multiple sugar transport system substrate-binding protein
MVQRFHDAQDAVEIEVTAVPESQFVTKLATAIRGRAVPDLVGVDDINGQLFMYRDTFTDLTEVVQDLDYLDNLSPGHLGLATFEDRNYGLPYLGDLSRLIYNRELFEQAGLDADDPPRDFPAILAEAEAVQALGGDVQGYSFAGNCPGCLGFTMLPKVWATGTDLFEGDIGEQTANIADKPAVPPMLELYQELWGTTWRRRRTAPSRVPPGARTSCAARSVSSPAPTAPSLRAVVEELRERD